MAKYEIARFLGYGERITVNIWYNNHFRRDGGVNMNGRKTKISHISASSNMNVNAPFA
jgi:hypothetical protein